MSDSIKDAMEKAGLAIKPAAAPKQDDKKWKHELPEDDKKPYVPFDAPAQTKTTDSQKK